MTLIEDNEFLRAYSKDAYGVTYTYPMQNSLKFMKRGFAIFITHSLSELKIRDLLIDTVLYELIHAKIHLHKLESKDDHSPIFLSNCCKVAAHFRIKMRINEHFEGVRYKSLMNKTGPGHLTDSHLTDSHLTDSHLTDKPLDRQPLDRQAT